jgi:Fe-S cluster biogenesis protein NfuA
MTLETVSVELEFTPNPNTLKYVTNVAFLLAGAENFPTAESAKDRSPLAVELFQLNGISAVMVGKNFVTVTLSDQDQLTELNEKIIDTIRNFVSAGKKAVSPLVQNPIGSSVADVSRTEVEQKIIELLENEIRPAVAMDGGDITFDRYENGVLFVQMKGSCSGCPSSTATLKMGIENRVRDIVPDLVEVIAI